ncbi:MAG: thiamine-phosphate kinase [Actinomycetales bacterium]|nr:thiamine-phosphate kinase [Actinomycetales bacterium]
MTGQTLAELGEHALIYLIQGSLGESDYVLIGSGDDAAHVATADGTYLVSTDLLIEGQHFRKDWSSAEDIGRKAVAVNLSDINAMGGVATALTVGLAAPGDTPVAWIRELLAGMIAECAKVGAKIVGGDLSSAETIILSITAMGDAERPVSRAGASAGDVVAVVGELGMAGAGFGALSRGFRSPKAAVDRHRVPEPPYAEGPQAAEAGATALIDVSDGLLADLGHIARASNVAIDLASEAFEIPEAVQTVASALGGVDPLQVVLSGGDDYALVGTFPVGAVPAGGRTIGAVTAGEGVTVDGQPFEGVQGHTHWG